MDRKRAGEKRGKASWVAFLGLIILLAQPVAAARPKLWFGLETGFFRPSSATLNNEFIPQINQVLEELQLETEELGFKSQFKPLGSVPRGFSLGFEAETSLAPYLSLSLGIGYWKKTLSGSVEASGKLNSFAYGLSDFAHLTLRLLPLRLSVRAESRRPAWRYFGGVGFALMLSLIEYRSQFQFLDLFNQLVEDNFQEKATGKALLPQLEAGADYDWKDRFRVGIIIRIPIGKIESLKITESTETQAIGERAKYLDSQGEERLLDWGISGWQLSLTLRYLF